MVTRGKESRGFLPQLSRVINFVSGGEKKTSKRLEIFMNAGRKFFDIWVIKARVQALLREAVRLLQTVWCVRSFYLRTVLACYLKYIWATYSKKFIKSPAFSSAKEFKNILV